jgi:hypothetical protein
VGIIPGALGRGKASASYTYDFAVQGGTVGVKTLSADAGQIPDNAIITDAYLEPLTNLTSGGLATVALGVTGDDEAFKVATAFDDAALTVANGASQEAVALPLKLSAAGDVRLTVAVAALTAGKLRLHVEYIAGS